MKAKTDDVTLIEGGGKSDSIVPQNTWAMEMEKKKSPDQDFEYNPRGSRYMDIDDGILPSAAQREAKNQWPITRIVGCALAIVSFIVLLCIEVESTEKNDFSQVNDCLAVLAPLVFLWLFSVFSPTVTALLPIPLYALLELDSSSNFAKTYLTDIGILFVGVFICCTAMEACNVHLRFALYVIDAIGKTPALIMVAFMIPPWFLSLFSSNAGVCAMILPVAMATMETSIRKAEEEDDKENVKGLKQFEKGLYMAIAYSATVGGVGTIIATPPNALVVENVENRYGVSMSFGDWILAFIPLSMVLQVACFCIMYFAYGRNVKTIDRSFVKSEYKKLGRPSFDEKVVSVVFFTMMLWMVLHEVTTKAWIGKCTIDEEVDASILNKYDCESKKGKWKTTFGTGAIAFTCSLVLFLIPSKKDPSRNLINWKMAESGVPWGIILLMGGGNAINKAFKSTDTTVWIANLMAPLAELNTVLLVFMITFIVAFLTEITSNTATTSILLPILLEFGDTFNFHPLLLGLPCALAASMAFMLPIATPTNAVVLGSGKVPFLGFVKAGWQMNIAGILLTTFFVCTTGAAVYSLYDAPAEFRVKWTCMQVNATIKCP